MRRALILSVEIVALIVSALVVLVGLLLWRLSSAPVSLETVQPWLANALGDNLSGISVSIGATEAAWGGLTDLLQLRLQNVTVTADDDSGLLSVPELTAVFSVRGILGGEYVPVELRLRRPHLTVNRGLAATAAPPPTKAGRDLSQVLGLFAAPSGSSSPFSELDEIDIVDGQVTIHHVRWQTPLRLTVPKLTSTRDANGLGLNGSARIAVGVPPAMLSLSALYNRDTGLLDSRVEFAGVDWDQITEFFPEIARLGRFEEPVSGFSNLTLDPQTLRLQQAKFAAQSGRGALRLADLLEAPIRFDQMRVNLDFDGATNSLTISQLDLRRGDSKLSTSALIKGPLAEQQWSVQGSADGLAIAELDQIWPENVLQLSRRWVMANLSGGTVDGVDFTVGGSLSNWSPKQAKLTDYAADIGFSDVQARVLKRLPPIQQTAGQIHLENDLVVISVTQGLMAKTQLQRGTITISETRSKAPQVVADIEVTGLVRDGFQIAAQALPKSFAATTLDPNQIDGSFAGRINLAFPLRKTVPIEAVTIGFIGDISNGQFKQVIAGRNLRNGEAKITIEQQEMRLEGTAEVAGIALTLDHRQWFDPANAVKSETHATAKLSPQEQARLGFDLDPYVRGPIDVEAVFQRPKTGSDQLQATLDFAQTALQLPQLDWQKPAQAAGVLHLTAVVPKTGDITISHFDLVGGELSASGRAAFRGGALSSLNLDRLTTQSADISLTATRDTTAGYAINIKGRRMNAQPLLRSWRQNNDQAFQNLKLVAAVEQVDVGLAQPLFGATMRVNINNGQLQQANVSTRLGAGELQVMAGGDGGLMIDASRADDLFEWLGFGRPIAGGKLTVRGHFLADGGFTGRARIVEFDVVDAPILAQIFRLASFTGILDALRGQSLSFKAFNGAIAFDQQAFQVTDGFAYGPSLGISVQGKYNRMDESVDFSGMVAPASALNLVINRFPILGRMITGGRKEGLLAAQYKVIGTVDEPTAVVNPLTAILPGFLRGLVRLGESEVDRNGGDQN